MKKISLITTKDPKKIPEVLREKSEDITEITQEIFDLAGKMIEIMNKNNGVGLAAIQVGVPIKLITIKEGDADYAFINPEIVKSSKKECVYNEGCLSFPDIFENVSRPERVKVRAKTLDGEFMELDADGLLARVFQHEIDHMKGVVFLDRVQED